MASFREVISTIFGTMGVVILTGRPSWKSGKTDFALLITECLLKWGVVKKAASNIRTEDERVKFIDNLIDLKRWLFADKERKIFILDEATSHLARRRAMTRQNITALSIIPEISKARAVLLLVTHSLQAIDQAFLSKNWCRAVIFKLTSKPLNKERTRFKVHQAIIVSDLIPGGEAYFDEIPPTSIKFDPYEIAPFTLTPAKRKFRSAELQALWNWAVEGQTWREQGLHQEQARRILRRFIRYVLTETEIFSEQSDFPPVVTCHTSWREDQSSKNHSLNKNIGEEDEEG